MIKLEKVSKSFGEKKVLQDIDLTINQGERLCIVGKSGCGKSVLLKLITGLLEPSSGEIFFDGLAVSRASKSEIFRLRQSIGYVFQGAALFDSYNVFDNIVLSLFDAGVRDRAVLEEVAVKVLSGVGLLPEKNEDKNPEFHKEKEILFNKMPSDLSGGMKKRVGVARALVGDPDYIFYDEPTTGLDPVTSEHIDDLIYEIDQKTDTTSIIITHDIFSVYRVAERVVMLADGGVKFDGTTQEFRETSDPEVQEFIRRFGK